MYKKKKLHNQSATHNLRPVENKENEKLSKDLNTANKELDFQNKEKEKRADELVIAKKELAFQNKEKGKRADELMIANKELAFQNKEKGKRADELVIANKELAFQNKEKGKRADELVIANKELAFQNKEKGKRAVELVVAKEEIASQKKEKKERAAELVIAKKELAFQEKEKKKRAAELAIANKKLKFENKEKEKRAIELENAQRKLEKKDSQFRFVLASAPIAMLLIDNKGLITYANRKTENLLGYEQKELTGKRCEFCIPDINSGNTRNEFTALTKAGIEILVEINLIPVETARGLMILVCVSDITERKELKISQKKQEESDIKVKEIEQFAYVTTHDLQEPLRTVSNYIQLIEKDHREQLDGNALKYIHSINSATKRMSALVKSILSFSRIGHTNKKTTSINCRDLIDEVIADLNSIIKESKTVIEIGEMPQLNVYETEFHQLFQNLITNAIKFCKKDSSPAIKISARQANGKWEFSVCDNGIGIASIHFSRVFDIFQRVNSDNEYSGHGIGLANCKKIVQLHHGEIWVESVPNQGATFHFTIPN
jgi:PAS domain S-box-containing protein